MADNRPFWPQMAAKIADYQPLFFCGHDLVSLRIWPKFELIQAISKMYIWFEF